MIDEIKEQLIDSIIPFWKALRDDEFGGYYGYMDFNLNVDRKYEKGWRYGVAMAGGTLYTYEDDLEYPIM